MDCRPCATPLDRPGDYCLVGHTANTDAVVLELDRERATVTSLLDGSVVGQRTVTTTPDGEGSDETVVVELRNFAGLVADEVRRKRPEDVYVTGDRDVTPPFARNCTTSSFASRATTPSSGSSTAGEPALEVVDAAPAEKLGGSHSTLIGGRSGRESSRPSPATLTSRRSSPAPSTLAARVRRRASGRRRPAPTPTATSGCSSATAPACRRTASSRRPATANSANTSGQI